MLDVSKINLCLYLSEQAYKSVTLRVGECECLVVQEPNAQYVAFRGTEGGGFTDILKKGGWLDILRDIRAIPWYSKRLGGWSHAGFLKGARGVVDAGLFGLLRRDVPIYFTGHSLGGALALNAACLMDSMDFNVAAVVTFGSPKTLTRRTAKDWLGSFPIKQFSNGSDPVTLVPAVLYSHVNEIDTGLDKGHSLEYYKEGLKKWAT